MKTQITYMEPYFDPETHEYDLENCTKYTVIANNQDEYDAHMAALENPERHIKGITTSQLPDDPPVISNDELTACLNALLGVR